MVLLFEFGIVFLAVLCAEALTCCSDRMHAVPLFALHHDEHIVDQLKVLILHKWDGLHILARGKGDNFGKRAAHTALGLVIHKFGERFHVIQKVLYLLAKWGCHFGVLAVGELLWLLLKKF
jgi:hypothetical protein